MTTTIAVAVLASSLFLGTSDAVNASPATASAGQDVGQGLAAAAPRNYEVVKLGKRTAYRFSQTYSEVACPGNKVPLGGGVSVFAGSEVNVGDSYPVGNKWAVHLNNASNFDVSFTVFAVCLRPPPNYNIVTSYFPTPPLSTTQATLSCTTGGMNGGGSFSSSGSTDLNINSSFPAPMRTWRVDTNNNSLVSAGVMVYTICSDGIANRTTVVGTPRDVAAGIQGSATAYCPAGYVPLSGGGLSNSLDSLTTLSVNLASSYPISGGWTVRQNNASYAGSRLTAYVRCATGAL